MPPALFFLLKIDLAIQCLFFYLLHINFRIKKMSVKNAVGISMGIAL